MEAILTFLSQHQIPFQHYQHPPFKGCEDSRHFHQEKGFPGKRAKNIFLRNKNGKKHFLLILPHEKEFDKKRFRELSGEKCGFASPERLAQYLQSVPGAVSPLGLIFDKEKAVFTYIDATLLEASHLHFHPNDPTSSLQMATDDFLRFLTVLKAPYQVIDF